MLSVDGRALRFASLSFPQVDASVLSIAHGDFERGLIQGFQETARVGLEAHQQEARACSSSVFSACFVEPTMFLLCDLYVPFVFLP